MIIRTDAVVLRTMRYGESSRIVTLLTREKGKVGTLAKGARRTKSRFGGALQPMAYVQVVLYFREQRGLQTLTEASYIETHSRVTQNLTHISVGLRLIELVSALLPEGEPNPSVFNLLVTTLRALDETEEAFAPNLLPFFQLRLAIVLGFAPAVRKEEVEAIGDDGGMLALDSGAILPPRGSAEHALPASRTALRAFAILARADLDAVTRLRLDATTRLAVDDLVSAYLRYHVEEAYPGRADHVLAQLLPRTSAPSARG